MITDLILGGIYAFVFLVTYPLRLLSDVVMPTQFSSAVTTANSYLSTANGIFPVDTLIQVVGIFLLIETGVILYKLIMWIIKRFPTQS